MSTVYNTNSHTKYANPVLIPELFIRRSIIFINVKQIPNPRHALQLSRSRSSHS